VSATLADPDRDDEQGATEVRARHRDVHGDSERLPLYVVLSREAACWGLIAALAWAQFPLGSNRPWAWSLLVLFIAAVWVLWTPALVGQFRQNARLIRRAIVPLFILGCCLIWAALQTVGWTPAAYHNSIWSVVAQATGKTPGGAVSMNPFVTATEAMKLFSYVCAGFLAYVLSARHEIAHRFLVAVFVIGTAYAIYGLILSAVFSSQVTLFEHTFPPPYWRDVTGGFVSKNSFATFTGIALIVGILLIVDGARHAIVLSRGARQLFLSVLQFTMGPQIFAILAALVLFGALAGSDSRAGMLATLSGLMALFVYGVFSAARRGAAAWAIGAGVVTLSLMVILFLAGGTVMESRIDALIETHGIEDLRPVMWGAAERAIADHPWTGTGLGTFHDSYGLYADRFDPYVFDRVHNDYLELVLGMGAPAAVLWILTIASMAVVCAIGVIRRKRRRIYSLAAVGASILVAVHSLFDFSLQMPAVSLLFAVVLGVGLAQSEPTAAAGKHRRVATSA
jgi:O-antigen ligase